jgi:3-oxoacyl-[acyl-carrier-protein] synthase-3
VTKPLRVTEPGVPAAASSRVGGYRPARVVTNDEIATRIDSSDEWIRERTGIIERRFAAPDETVVDMAVAAAGKALAASGIAPDQRSTCVLVATVTHPYQTPSAAAEVATGSARPTVPPRFDISAACAGFCYALGIADSTGPHRHVGVRPHRRRREAHRHGRPVRPGLLVHLRRRRRRRGGRPSDHPGIGPVVWGADGGRPTRSRGRSRGSSARRPDRKFPTLSMNGPAGVPLGRGPDGAGLPAGARRRGRHADHLDAFIPHQANLRITDAMVKKLGLPEHVAVARDIVTTGNTSAASVPLAMDALLDRGEAAARRAALLVGFGAGLSYAAQVVSSRDPQLPRRSRDHTGCTVERPPSLTDSTRREPSMATQQEILSGLADIVNEVAGVPVADVQLDKSFVDDLDIDSLSMVEVVVACRGEVRRQDPRRRRQGPQDRRRRRRVHREAAGA